MASSCIPPDPDISGVGDRVAAYIQNFLSFIPAILALQDGIVIKSELKAAERHTKTVLITAFAILISAMVEARTVGLSNFHASIVLSLSWMNNEHVHLLSALCSAEEPRAHTSRWSCLLGPSTVGRTFGRILCLNQAIPRSSNGQSAETTKGIGELSLSKGVGELRPGIVQAIRSVVEKFVLVLGGLHLSVMAALGIWLWSHPNSFGTSVPCTIGVPSTVILGHSVPLVSSRLRSWSIAIYSLFLVPRLNLVLPIALFVYPFLFYWAVQQKLIQVDQESPLSGPSTRPVAIGLVFLFLIDLIFLVDIELTLLYNQRLRASSESAWTFGQIVALLLLLLPVQDMLETLSRSPEAERQEAAAEKSQMMLCRSIRDQQTDHELILDLCKAGADVNTVVDGILPILDFGMSTPARVVAAGQDIDYENTENGSRPQYSGGKYGTALGVASFFGNVENVEELLANGAVSNIKGGKYGTALQASIANGNGADVNIRGTALQAASYTGSLEIAELLLDKGADINAKGGEYGTALRAACKVRVSCCEGYPVPIVFEAGGTSETALQVAIASKQRDMIKILLENGADVNARGREFGAALQVSRSRDNQEVVDLLLANRQEIAVC
ncbi:ankyrin repeat-containing domain protein [Mycena galericulata]|nr:ankyrin repeat-containing domain protein [Mycena galericulata]